MIGAAIDTFIHEMLSADGRLEGVPIYADVASPGTREPFIVFSLQDARDARTIGAGRVLTHATYLVKAVQRSESFTTVYALADIIDDVLDGASGMNAAGAVLWVERELPIRYTEVTDSGTYKHAGALYRVYAREE